MSKPLSGSERSKLLIEAIDAAPVSMAIMDAENYISNFSDTASLEHFEALMGVADRYYFPEFLKLSIQNGDIDRGELSPEEYIARRLRSLRERPTSIERQSRNRWFETRSQPADDGSVFFVSFDITDRKLAQEQLRVSQRLEAVGQLAGGVAHDFNNLLAIILGNLELALEEFEDQRLKELLQPCIGATMRGAELTKNILSFARQAHLEPQSVELPKLVRKTTAWMSRTLPASIQVNIRHDDTDPTALVDESAAENALINLIINARDAMPDGGKLTIETGFYDVEGSDETQYSDTLTPGRYAMIAVSDTGIGIEKRDIGKIFEPFYSTKQPGKGSGLGLSMVHGFMRQSGGSVRAYSKVGTGTTIKLVFPIAGNAHGVKDHNDPTEHHSVPESRRILVAEDEPEVLAILVRSLSKAGFLVDSANNGDQAVAVFHERGPFDALVTDIVMPGTLQGPDLAKTLRASHPELPVVFLSGYAPEATIHGNGLRPEDIRLMKPVRSRVLVEAVQKALKPVY